MSLRQGRGEMVCFSPLYFSSRKGREATGDTIVRVLSQYSDKILPKMTEHKQLQLDNLLELRIDFGSLINGNNLRDK